MIQKTLQEELESKNAESGPGREEAERRFYDDCEDYIEDDEVMMPQTMLGRVARKHALREQRVWASGEHRKHAYSEAFRAKYGRSPDNPPTGKELTQFVQTHEL